MYLKRMAVKLISLCLVLGMIISVSACGSRSSSSDSSTGTSTGTVEDSSIAKDSNTEEDSSGAESSDEVDYSKFDGVTLKYWVRFDSTYIKSLEENIVFQELEKRTNIKIDFITPPAGQSTESYNLMIASGDLPDIVDDGGMYPGGGAKAVADGIYLKLNDYIDKYAPNYKKAMAANPSIERQAKEDDGTIWCFHMIQLDQEPPWAGPNIDRKSVV